MPEFYPRAILQINQQDEIGEKQLSIYGSRGGKNSPLMHVPLSKFFLLTGKIHMGVTERGIIKKIVNDEILLFKGCV